MIDAVVRHRIGDAAFHGVDRAFRAAGRGGAGVRAQSVFLGLLFGLLPGFAEELGWTGFAL